MTAVHYSKFYWSDHCSDPRLAMCSLAARGLWVHMQGLAAQAEPFGHVLVNGRAPENHELARLVGAPQDQVEAALAELEANGVFSRDSDGRIYSRRMVRDAAKSAEMVRRGKGGGNPQLLKETRPGEVNHEDKLVVNHEDKPEVKPARQLNHEDKPKVKPEVNQSLVIPESRIQKPLSESPPLPPHRGAAHSLDFDDLPEEWREAATEERRKVPLGPVNLDQEWRIFRQHTTGQVARDWRSRWLKFALQGRALPNGQDAAPGLAAVPAGADIGEALAASRARHEGVTWGRSIDWWRQFDPIQQTKVRVWVERGEWRGLTGPPGSPNCAIDDELAAAAVAERAKRIGASPGTQAGSAEAGPADQSAAPPAKSSRRKPGPAREQPSLLMPLAGGAAELEAQPEAVKHKPRQGDRDPRTQPPPGRPWPGDSFEGRPPAKEAG